MVVRARFTEKLPQPLTIVNGPLSLYHRGEIVLPRWGEETASQPEAGRLSVADRPYPPLVATWTVAMPRLRRRITTERSPACSMTAFTSSADGACSTEEGRYR